MSLYQQYLKALDFPSKPVLFLDEDAFNQNINWVINHAAEKKIRLATKSIRCREIFKKVLSRSPIFQGLMTYDLREALWLRDCGHKDILMGYPTTDNSALEQLAQNPEEITLMVDLPEHLEMIHILAKKYQKEIRICLDIDLSMDLFFIRFGVYRSSLNTKERIHQFLKILKNYPLLKVVGVMGYEAQIAGVGDQSSLLIRGLKKISQNQLQTRRKAFVEMIRSEGHQLSLINGGGTGSLLKTTQEDIVTEVTVGSAFYAPHLFDHYKDFKLSPALAFTLPIARSPEKNIYTCFGGGYVASGALEKSKLPLPYLPEGMIIFKHEGFGEVQTPIFYNGNESLNIGQSLIFRHSKAGEVCERFSSLHIIKDNQLIATTPTYRGEGKNFI